MRFLFLTLLAVLPLEAIAEDYCDIEADMAANIMEARQSEVPMDMMLNVNAQLKMEKRDRATMDAVVRAAFKQPLCESDKRKDRAVKDFRNQRMRACRKAAK